MDITFKEGNIKFDYRVAVFIQNNNKFLFQQMEGDFNYTLIGGRVGLMETSVHSIIRELKEELGISVEKKDLNLVEIAENFFDYYNKNNDIELVHSILFIYKLNISDDNEITKKNDFCVLDKTKTKLYWIDKKDISNVSILPKIATRLISKSDFSYDIIDDTKKGIE